MMKRNKRLTWIALLIALSCFFLTGCSDKESKDAEQWCSVVVSGHDYFPKVSLEFVRDVIYETCYTYGRISFVVVEGTPTVAGNYKINKPNTWIDDQKRRQISSDYTEQIMAEMSNLYAVTEEVDTLGSIDRAAGLLESAPEHAKKTMVIYDSGLSTIDLLDFTKKNLIDMPAENVVEQMKERYAIPQLTEVQIIWYGCGETGGIGEQPMLTKSYSHKLKALWKEILEAGGASVEFRYLESYSEHSVELPACTTVPVIADQLEIDAVVSSGKLPYIIRWDENSSVQFLSDSSQFVDENMVIEQFRPISEYLINHPEESIYVFGMTASTPGQGDGVTLSKERAKACKNILEELGAKESQIMAAGLGSRDNVFRVTDLDENGVQIEELAQKNRAVFIIKSEDPILSELLPMAKGLE